MSDLRTDERVLVSEQKSFSSQAESRSEDTRGTFVPKYSPYELIWDKICRFVATFCPSNSMSSIANTQSIIAILIIVIIELLLLGIRQASSFGYSRYVFLISVIAVGEKVRSLSPAKCRSIGAVDQSHGHT